MTCHDINFQWVSGPHRKSSMTCADQLRSHGQQQASQAAKTWSCHGVFQRICRCLTSGTVPSGGRLGVGWISGTCKGAAKAPGAAKPPNSTIASTPSSDIWTTSHNKPAVAIPCPGKVSIALRPSLTRVWRFPVATKALLCLDITGTEHCWLIDTEICVDGAVDSLRTWHKASCCKKRTGNKQRQESVASGDMLQSHLGSVFNLGAFAKKQMTWRKTTLHCLRAYINCCIFIRPGCRPRLGMASGVAQSPNFLRKAGLVKYHSI